jgi:hypothetical protein
MEYKFTQLFIPLILLLIILLFVKNQKSEVVSVRSTVDHVAYIVQNKKDKQQAADLLAQLRAKLLEFVAGLQSSSVKDDDRVKRLISKFQADHISEGDTNTNYTTYTLNKGEKIVFCLRTRDKNDNLHDLNMMLFVAIHEMGHICTLSTGHTEEFQKNFKFLLEEAVKLKIYQPVNYRENPTTYCGIAVTDTPLEDKHFK